MSANETRNDWELKLRERHEQEERERKKFGPCPNCGHNDWRKGIHYMNCTTCHNCGLGIFYPYDDSTYTAWREKHPEGEKA